MDVAVFLIQCPDRRGIVAAISGFFSQRSYNILQCQQYTDSARGQYFMRIKIDLNSSDFSASRLESEFESVAAAFRLKWSAHFSTKRQRVAILCTKTEHCIYDLIIRQRSGELPCTISVIISNHLHLEHIAHQFDIPFYHAPVNAGSRDSQERTVLQILRQHRTDLVVLARYMQILSPTLIEELQGRVINIHHAVLPAFEGARPYERAYERGVKMIGATAHYATSDLDQGPIIEQDVARVTHEETVADLKRIGRDIERVVLARAVKAHLEHRIITSGPRTIVFSAS
ncbi:MAG: formyltetrahydrofolate deformylase [Deltaproteobacteria bacterium]|nr:formyltetrahydrofolate deformylase [Deltaproteobacteria bacterium]